MTRQQPTTQLRDDSRAVSEVIGAILIFALLFVLLVLIQVNAVPAANKQVEFEHNKRVTQDFQSLQEGLHRVGTTGSELAVSVETGISYPPRFFLLNPGPAIGSLRTTDPLAVRIDDAVATGNARDYWNGDEQAFTTRAITYTPDYNELPNAGTNVWEHSMLYKRYEGDSVYFDDPTSVVDGRQIRLTLVDGTLSRGSLSTSVEMAPISTGTRTVSVEGDGGPITMTLGTTLGEDDWIEALEDEPYATVKSYNATAETVTIRLDADQTYDLRISKVRIGTTVTPEPGPRYITDVEGNGTSIAENTTRRLTVEVRDQYNNPVSNVPVTARIQNDLAVPDDALQPIGSSQTDSDGQVTYRYDAPENVDGAKQIRVQTSMENGIDDTTTDAAERATFDLTVLDSDGSGIPPGSTGNQTGSEINPYGSESVILTDVQMIPLSGTPCQKGTGNAKAYRCPAIRFDLKNLGQNERTIKKARFVFFSSNIQFEGGNPNNPPRNLPQELEIIDDGESFTGTSRLARLGSYKPVTLDKLAKTESAGDTQQYRVQFYRNGSPYWIYEGDFFAIAVLYENGQTATYFVGVERQ